jgi:hypothetical protein
MADLTHIMLDLETLGTKPGCKVLSIGACVFSIHGIGATFYEAMDLETIPGTLEMGTFKWWLKQSDVARRAAFFGTENHEDAMRNFTSWVWAKTPVNIWADQVDFDLPILEASMLLSGVAPSWNHRVKRDGRTVQKIAGIEVARFGRGAKCDARTGAISQAEATIKALNAIGWPTE